MSVASATIWIGFSEFFRNDMLVKSLWEEHYQAMGLTFPSAPINGLMWGLWSLLCALGIYFGAKQFTVWKTTLLVWLFAFVMMWVALGNLDVLPYKTLLYAIPLSILEVLVAVIIVRKTG